MIKCKSSKVQIVSPSHDYIGFCDKKQYNNSDTVFKSLEMYESNILCHQTAMYSSGYYGDWMTSNGQLPRARTGLKAAMINSDLYVTGGLGTDGTPFTSILYWDPNQRYPSWKSAGDLKVARHSHAAVAIPSSIIESECPALT